MILKNAKFITVLSFFLYIYIYSLFNTGIMFKIDTFKEGWLHQLELKVGLYVTSL